MASGILHTKASLMISAAAVPYYGLDRPDLAAAALLAGLWAVVVQPDLDQIDTSGGYYGGYVLERTSPVLAWVWMRYWWLYSKLPHRSFLSHAPIVGTLIRLVYGGWWFLPFLGNEAGAVFLSLVIAADTLHWVMDWKVWGAFRIFAQG